MPKQIRIRVAQNLPKHVPDFVKYCRNVLQSMRSNAVLFPNSTQRLDQAEQNLNQLDAAETESKSRTKGTIEKRNVCLTRSQADFEYLKTDVQQAADANPEKAEAIIQSSGMSVRKPVNRIKSDFDVRQGEVSGSVQINVRAMKGRSAYEWQMSTDQRTWTNLPVTVHARTTVQNLTPATTYYFRFKVVSGSGEGEWSQIVSFLVK